MLNASSAARLLERGSMTTVHQSTAAPKEDARRRTDFGNLMAIADCVVRTHGYALVVQEAWVVTIGTVFLGRGYVVVETTGGQVLDWLQHTLGTAVDAARPCSSEVGGRVVHARRQAVPGRMWVSDLEPVNGQRHLPGEHDRQERVVGQEACKGRDSHAALRLCLHAANILAVVRRPRHVQSRQAHILARFVSEGVAVDLSLLLGCTALLNAVLLIVRLHEEAMRPALVSDR
eukprot:scaffold102236_cov67-Phaeocystis_antarctica.AAC.1